LARDALRLIGMQSTIGTALASAYVALPLPESEFRLGGLFVYSAANRNAFFLTVLLLATTVVPSFAQIDIENTGAKVFGPVELREGQSFDLCANARFNQFFSTVTASFRTVQNTAVEIRSQSMGLEPGDGGCTSVSYAEVFAEVGEVPIFALLTTVGDGPAERDPVASACVSNGIFTCPPLFAVETAEEIDADTAEITTFGPLRLKPDTALQVCASNAFNTEPVFARVSLFLARDSSEPIVVRSSVLRPGRGRCVEIPYERVRNRPIFAELEVQATTTDPNFRKPVLAGAGVTNGIFQPVPGERRTQEVEQ